MRVRFSGSTVLMKVTLRPLSSSICFDQISSGTLIFGEHPTTAMSSNTSEGAEDMTALRIVMVAPLTGRAEAFW